MTNPEIKLRFLVIETERIYDTSWCSSSEGQSFIEKSNPVLQYSINSGEWITVDTVVEKGQ